MHKPVRGRLSRLVLFIHLAALAAVGPAAAQSPFTLRYSLFDPGTNIHAYSLQGYSVAVDENTAVVGAPGLEQSGSGVVNIYDAATGTLLHTLFDRTAIPYDRFGSAVAISGKRVVVGTPNAWDRPGRVHVFDLASATPTVPVMTLTNPVAPARGDLFGYSLAISGSWLVIGSLPGVDSFGPGIAFVYDLASATPTVPVVTLTNPISSNFFATTVAISGTRAIVGGPNGAAYVYDIAGPTPNTPVVTLKNPPGTGTTNFGRAVAIAGTRAVVGGPAATFVYDVTAAAPNTPMLVLNVAGSGVALSGARLAVASAGTVNVYDLEGATPSQAIATLNNPRPGQYSVFPSSVAISGARVLVGDAFESSAAQSAGAAYLYDLTSANATSPVAVLRDPRPPSGDYFGLSVAASGTRVIVGAWGDDSVVTDAGRAYVYDLASPTPTDPVATLPNPAHPTGNQGLKFGLVVGISGTLAVVGGPGTYVYDLTKLDPPEPIAAFTNSGYAVAISGTRVVTGAYSYSGTVYIYDFATTNPTVPAFILNNPGPAGDGFGTSVAIYGTRVVIGAPSADSYAGRVYVYDLSTAAPTVPIMTLNVPAPGVRNFGSSVAISGSRLVIGAPYGTGPNYFGSAYAYDLSSGTPTVPVVRLESPAPFAYDMFGEYVTISGTLVTVQEWNTFRIYIYDISRPTPGTAIATFPYTVLAAAISGRSLFLGSHSSKDVVYVYSPTQPGLTIAAAGSNSATISWTPVDWPDFVLQYNDTLAPDSWVNAPSGANNPVTVSSANAARFYRLFSP